MTVPLEVVLFTRDTIESHRLPASGTVLIGRGEDTDVRVADPSVSRRHALLHLGPPLQIEDLGGTNGTVVRGTPNAPSGAETGAETVDLKPFSSRAIEIALGEWVMFGSVLAVVRHAADSASPKVAGDAVVEHPSMHALYEHAKLAARGLISVLLLGETGVGKEVRARAIHDLSPRALDRPADVPLPPGGDGPRRRGHPRAVGVPRAHRAPGSGDADRAGARGGALGRDPRRVPLEPPRATSRLRNAPRFVILLVEPDTPMTRPLVPADLPEEAASFAEKQIAAGRFANVEAFITAGMIALKERDEAKMAVLRSAIDEGDASGVAEGDSFARVRAQLGITRR